MQIFDKTAGDTTTSQLSAGVEGWVETGLFGQTTVAVVGSDAVLLLTNFDGQVGEAELIALATTVQKVDDMTWVDRLAIAPLFKVPVMG